MPIGGLISEISHISTMNTPKNTGSMPAACTIGKTTGTVPTSIGMVSSAMPSTR
ncbi:hypothetical protein D3C79_1101840 [compost metagenome]